MLDAILFDLDGTLLPMDNDTFIKAYLGLLAKTAAPLGYEKESMINALWKGVGKIVKNDGRMSNYKVFWETFGEEMGDRDKIFRDIPVFHKFYGEEFQEAKSAVGENPLARKAVQTAHRKGKKVILATTPQFPKEGILTRLGWIGLAEEDFDDITDYENWSYSKPNPYYYTAIAEKHGLRPENCLMIGNDMQEDIRGAEQAGMKTYLVTDCMIGNGEEVSCPRGTFGQMLAFLEDLQG